MALKVKGIKTVTDNLNKWADDRISGIIQFNKFTASKVQTEARGQARWNNITGNARQGLTGQAYEMLPTLFIALFHKVDYGKYLELSNDGKFAIIEEILNKNRLEWFQGVRRLLNRSVRI